ncbi:DUF1376 domain-containing protein [Escherichia coli]|nr:DUF1376 domain-containing protein [Escherichia coli]
MLFVLILSNRAASYGAIMAALPYMQLYIADYLADTMHLSAEEHGAYLLLMFNYWQTGKPIPKNRLAKIARLTNERWADVEPSLREFFCDNGEEWVHLRIEEDLASVREKLTKKSAAGKASVQARRSRKKADVQTKQERNLTGVQTDVEVVFEHDVNTKATNKDTDKDLKTDPPLNPPRGNRGVKKFDPLDIALPNWISVSLWREWVEFRQALRKPIRTEQGANGAIVPEEMDLLTCHLDGVTETYAEGWNACRAALLQGKGEPGKQVRELTMLVKQLVSQLKKAKPGCKLPDKVMDYLERSGLISVEDVLR